MPERDIIPERNESPSSTIEALQKQLTEQNTLLAISNAIAKVKDRNGLLHIINSKLKELFHFTHSIILQLTADKQHLEVFIVDPNSHSRSYPDYERIVFNKVPVNDTVIDVALASPTPMLFNIDERFNQGNAPEYFKMHYNTGIRETVITPLRLAGTPLGVIAFYSDKHGSFHQNARDLILTISYHLSTAMANILYHEDILHRDRENEALLQISHSITTIRNRADLSQLLQHTLKRYMHFNDAIILTYIKENKTLKAVAWHLEGARATHPLLQQALENEFPITDTTIANSHTPVIVDIEELYKKGKEQLAFVFHAGLQELTFVKLFDGNEFVGAIVFLSETKNNFTPEHVALVQRLSYQISIVTVNIMANEKIKRQLEEINQYKQQLEDEKLYLQEEVRQGNTYNDIIGAGEAMQKVFHLLSQVSFTNSTVLILGETGTGKELIARAIHNASYRKDKLMVKVNCASIPSTLIESELFGHEKGAFTGAIERRIGKFELANHGTLFLDEIGEMPLEMQAKLLRALQEKEIERVGGKATIKVDVRILAATNRNLQKEVAEGRFRSDLYYRLNVFPITIPPLRERQEDIPLLTSSFVERFSRNAGKHISNISSRAMKELQAYTWPGNVRELEHLIERSILLTTGNTLKDIHLPGHEASATEATGSAQPLKTLEEMERNHILDVLKCCNGRIYGIGGAAEILGLKRTTLLSKMERLGIKKGETSFVRVPK